MEKSDIFAALIKGELTTDEVESVSIRFTKFKMLESELNAIGIKLFADIPAVNAKTTIERAFRDGKCNRYKISLIKEYRSLTGVGLKEAKDAVERLWQFDGDGNAIID